MSWRSLMRPLASISVTSSQFEVRVIGEWEREAKGGGGGDDDGGDDDAGGDGGGWVLPQIVSGAFVFL